MTTKTRKRQLVAGLAVISFLVIGLIAMTLIGTQRAYGDKTEYQINEDGLTYGNDLLAMQIGEEPDLLAAIATNDKEGYVYTVQLNDAINSDKPSNPNEAVRMMKDRAIRNSPLFIDYLSKSLGVLIEIDDDIALSAYEKAINIVSYKAPDEKPGVASEKEREELAQILALDASVLPSGDELFDLLLYTMSQTNEEFWVEIPVYQEDGKTQIGFFRVYK